MNHEIFNFSDPWMLTLHTSYGSTGNIVVRQEQEEEEQQRQQQQQQDK